MFPVHREENHSGATHKPADARRRRGTGGEFCGRIQQLTLPGGAAILRVLDESLVGDAIGNVCVRRPDNDLRGAFHVGSCFH